MKGYFSFITLRFKIALQYRFAAIAGIMTQFFWGAMYIMIYEAYYRNGIDVPMPWEQLVSYVWIGQAFIMLTRFYNSDAEIRDAIMSGQVAYELIRPFSIYWHWFSKIFASKTAAALLRCVPIFVFASILPTNYSLKAPQSFLAFVLFALTLLLGFILLISFSMIIYSLMFYTTSSKGLFTIYGMIARFLCWKCYSCSVFTRDIAKDCLCFAI